MSINNKQKLLDLEEQLILEVHAREALWNPQVNLSRRSRKATAQLWKEISEALNGKQIFIQYTNHNKNSMQLNGY